MNFSGKIGDYVVYEYRGKTCIRHKPREPKLPSSPGQVAQQERMASIAILYQALKEVGIYPYWQQAAQGRIAHGYNLLLKANLPAFNYEGLICDFAKLQPTPNLLPLPDGLELAAEAGGTWRLSWRNTPCIPRAKDDDRLWLLLMRDGDTYTIDTLRQMRALVGPSTPLVLILGADQWKNFHTWRSWSEFLDFANIALCNRASEMPRAAPEVEAFVKGRFKDASEITNAPAGSLCMFSIPAHQASSTKIRELFARLPQQEGRRHLPLQEEVRDKPPQLQGSSGPRSTSAAMKRRGN